MGWHVVSIPFFDWDELLQPEQMDAYVRQRLLQFQDGTSVLVLILTPAAGLNPEGCAGSYSQLSE
jgi:hypothetical protein